MQTTTVYAPITFEEIVMVDYNNRIQVFKYMYINVSAL